MIQRSRTPAAAILFIVLAAGIFFLGISRRAGVADDAELQRLQKAVAQPNAGTAVWLEYATKLEQAGQLANAARAYQHILESDAYNAAARLQCAGCLAKVGNADELFAFLKSTLEVNPKLALNLCSRPEMARFMGELRFVALKEEAVAGSMD